MVQTRSQTRAPAPAKISLEEVQKPEATLPVPKQPVVAIKKKAQPKASAPKQPTRAEKEKARSFDRYKSADYRAWQNYLIICARAPPPPPPPTYCYVCNQNLDELYYGYNSDKVTLGCDHTVCAKCFFDITREHYEAGWPLRETIESKCKCGYVLGNDDEIDYLDRQISGMYL